MTDRIYNCLFLCTHNSARSILSEGLMNDLGRGRFRAFSAGSFPSGKVNPFALATLEAMGISTRELRSKSWQEFASPDAPEMDFIITVCDNAAGEVCPIWPGKPASAHWGVEDPSAMEGSDGEKRAEFERVAAILRSRIELLLAMPASEMDASSVSRRLREIGEVRG